LVGANGSGKSTLVKLLLGLYVPDEGRILADGLDLASVDPRARRAAISAVFQDHIRFQLTVAEAIGFGDLHTFLHTDAGRARLRRAARAAGAADFVESLAHGYDTPLGRVLDEQGTDLSGGQWQRLAIARALYAEPEVLVLDEPAAALDPQAEADLYAYFGGLASERRTTLLVTHRLGAARIADRIAVLHGGRIVEEGTHADLARAGGLYAELWAVQAGWYE
jgi:ABC-type multidrug transport system fused ATPase/permease subunit